MVVKISNYRAFIRVLGFLGISDYSYYKDMFDPIHFFRFPKIEPKKAFQACSLYYRIKDYKSEIKIKEVLNFKELYNSTF